MASITKLVLVPVDDWLRITRDRKDIDARAVKRVEINRPTSSSPTTLVVGQDGGGGGPTPPPTPTQPPRERKEEEEGEEGVRDEYIPRHDTGKNENRPEDIGIWRPPGDPMTSTLPTKKKEKSKSETKQVGKGLKRKWIHI